MSTHFPQEVLRIKSSAQSLPSPNHHEVAKAACVADGDGEASTQQLLLPYFRLIAEVVPGPPYENITDMNKFVSCIEMFETHEIPANMLLNTQSELKKLDVVKRINVVRRSMKDIVLAKRIRKLVEKWREFVAPAAKPAVAVVHCNGNGGACAGAPSVVDAFRERLVNSAASSPAASSPLVNGSAERSGVDHAESQQKVPKLKIKFGKGADLAVVVNGSREPSPARRQLVDSSDSVISPKRRMDDKEQLVPAATTESLDETAGTQQPALKKRRTKPVKKRRIDLSDDEDSESDADADISSSVPSSSTLALRQQLADMLKDLPPISDEVRLSTAKQFAEFYAEQERSAAIYRAQQGKRVADEAAAARLAANDAAVAADAVLPPGSNSPYRGYGGPGSNQNIDAVISFMNDDDDDDDLSFGQPTTTSTPNKFFTDSNTSKYAPNAGFAAGSSQISGTSSALLGKNAKQKLISSDIHSVPDDAQNSKYAADADITLQPASSNLSSEAFTAAVGEAPPSSSSMDVDAISAVDAAAEAVAAKDESFMRAVAAVDKDFLTRLHTQNVHGCNGYYEAAVGADGRRIWHDWTEGYVTKRSDGKRIVVAPYVVLD